MSALGEIVSTIVNPIIRSMAPMAKIPILNNHLEKYYELKSIANFHDSHSLYPQTRYIPHSDMLNFWEIPDLGQNLKCTAVLDQDASTCFDYDVFS
jgi:hypothetical protein